MATFAVIESGTLYVSITIFGKAAYGFSPREPSQFSFADCSSEYVQLKT